MRNFKKQILLLVGGSVMASGALAADFHDQISFCQAASGKFAQARADTNEVIGICRLGPSVVGSTDLAAFLAPLSGMSISIWNYKHNIRDCTVGDGRRELLTDLENNQRIEICRFRDGSLMDLASFQAGQHSRGNSRLNDVVGAR